MSRVTLTVIRIMLLLPFCFTGNHGGYYAQDESENPDDEWGQGWVDADHGPMIKIDPWAHGAIPGDLEATFERATNTFMSNYPELPFHYTGKGDCVWLVGYEFSMNYRTLTNGKTLSDVITLERTVGEMTDNLILLTFPFIYRYTEVDADENEVLHYYALETSAYIKYSEEAEIHLAADSTRIDVGDETNVYERLTCGGQPYDGRVDFKLEGVGNLSDEWVMESPYKITFHGTEEGLATITGTHISYSTLGEEPRIITDSVSIRVGPPGLEVELLYQATMPPWFSTTFTSAMNILLSTDASGNVTGQGAGQSTVDYNIDIEVPDGRSVLENWQYQGLDTCTATGTFDGKNYKLQLHADWSLHFEMVFYDENGIERIRTPIDSDVHWDSLSLPEIEISNNPDDTFSYSGSVPGIDSSVSVEVKWE